ncbi:hypothetical protein NFHSH190041_36900 (plasmid) [Shewanella sp. NFH-SH190041]|nr:hypothetical protein NFHSH190041_36900 [Shewanella sp. NFH-SH190041]
MIKLPAGRSSGWINGGIGGQFRCVTWHPAKMLMHSNTGIVFSLLSLGAALLSLK